MCACIFQKILRHIYLYNRALVPVILRVLYACRYVVVTLFSYSFIMSYGRRTCRREVGHSMGSTRREINCHIQLLVTCLMRARVFFGEEFLFGLLYAVARAIDRRILNYCLFPRTRACSLAKSDFRFFVVSGVSCTCPHSNKVIRIL